MQSRPHDVVLGNFPEAVCLTGTLVKAAPRCSHRVRSVGGRPFTVHDAHHHLLRTTEPYQSNAWLACCWDRTLQHIFQQPSGRSWAFSSRSMAPHCCSVWLVAPTRHTPASVEPPMQVISERLSMSGGGWTRVPGLAGTAGNEVQRHPFPAKATSQRPPCGGWAACLESLRWLSSRDTPHLGHALVGLGEATKLTSLPCGVLKTTISGWFLNLCCCPSFSWSRIYRLLPIYQNKTPAVSIASFTARMPLRTFQREAIRACAHRAAPAPLRSVSEPNMERMRSSGAVSSPCSAGWGKVPRSDVFLRRANNRARD